MLEIEPIPAFRDNYIWALSASAAAVVVDPGDAVPVERWLAHSRKRLAAILVTHHHRDHTGGLAMLKRRWAARIYGPAAELIEDVDVAVAEGDRVTPAAGFPAFGVLEVPGHTGGHVAYYGAGLLFCGDTLFSAGCGRLFEGTPAQLYHSLGRLAALPAETRVYAGHEYTVDNLRFARSLLPADDVLAQALENAVTIRADAQVTLPSTIGREREINLFLRVGEPGLRAAIAERTAGSLPTHPETFAALRRLKDSF